MWQSKHFNADQAKNVYGYEECIIRSLNKKINL